ncbi:PGAP1-like protein-domain-containing protein [Scheffersomyces coipomensis]|uniref:PGAP1-like protein-domain-containing protein n=1 Tax=Scheffersomyces coipomensis TaxID=1788519 RepID=UPI00315D1C90
MMVLHNRTKIRSNRLIVWINLLLGSLIISLIAFSYIRKPTDVDSSGCRVVYMYPSYARILAFDESHTKFASKYSLYLYREQGKDPVPDPDHGYQKLDGIPVLFIPGNAGSYRQVRSIASESANLYFDDYVHRNSPTYRNLDFFTADFNEDFTAFHGRTILDQAEYLNEAVKFILELYSNNVDPPSSVIIVGHSMGGIVSRVMLTLPNYIEGSINTIVTLASPHAAAPLTFDGDLLKIYSAIDRFWYDGFHNVDENEEKAHHADIAKARLKELSLISITGGNLDSTLPADYTTLGFLVPPSNGFTVYTTGIPNVWTPIDHLAIVWCAQLRRQLATILLEIVDYERPTKTKTLDSRMDIFKQYLLTGLESDKARIEQETPVTNEIKVKLDSSSIIRERKIRINKDLPPKGKFYAFHLNKNKDEEGNGNGNGEQFSILSSIKAAKSWQNIEEDNNNWGILLCNNLDDNEDNSDIIDYTTEKTKEYVALRCKDISQVYDSIIPRSMIDTNSLMYSSFGGDKSPFHGIKIDTNILSKSDVVVLVSSINPDKNDDFLIAELSDLNSSKFELGKSLFTLMRRGGADISLPSTRPLLSTIKVPSAWSSLLEYKLFINNKNKSGEFSTFIRQWIESPYESKWHINIDGRKNDYILINLHGVAPYVPFEIKDDHGINLEMWSVPTVNNDDDHPPLDLELKIDFIRSLRLLILRYRLTIVSICVSITLSVFLVQLKVFFETNKFPTFIAAFSYINSGTRLGLILVGLVILNPIVKISWVKTLLNMFDPVVLQDSNEINVSLDSNFKFNSYYLGLEENALCFLSVIFYFMGNALVLLTYTVIFQISRLLKTISKLIFSSSSVSSPSPTRPSSASSSSSKSTEKLASSSSKNYKGYRRLIISLILLLLIPIYIPYQIVYIIGCLVQLINYFKSSIKTASNDLQNYHLTLLILMLWILPVNIPIVIVFVHNLAINWKTPFSSHHNLLSIAPIILLMERNSTLKKLPIINGAWFKNCGLGLIVYFVGYCLIYGSCHTYWIHHLLNILSCWLFLFVLSGDKEEEAEQEDGGDMDGVTSGSTSSSPSSPE